MRQLVDGLLRRIVPGAPVNAWTRLVAITLLGVTVTGSLAAIAVAVDEPLVFPSLGPTVYALLHKPWARISAPRSIVLGHAAGIAAGVVALWAFGLLDAPVPMDGPVSWARAAAAALSVGLTLGTTTGLDIAHPPAAATTLIVSLGFITRPGDLLMILVAVVALAVLGATVHRVAGLRTPWWSPADPRR